MPSDAMQLQHAMGPERGNPVVRFTACSNKALAAFTPTLTETEWLDRYKARFVHVGLTDSQADACARAESFAVLSEMFEDDPEGAADMEMSYWDAD